MSTESVKGWLAMANEPHSQWEFDRATAALREPMRLALDVIYAAKSLYVRSVPENGTLLLTPSTYVELCKAIAAFEAAD